MWVMIRAEAASPLVSGGQQLLPSVTRVFSQARELYVFLQAYEPGRTVIAPLVAFVGLYRDGVKVFETSPPAVTEGMDAQSRAVPIRFSMPLERVLPGRYDCQVTVHEPDGQKAAFWRAPIAIVP